MGARHVRFALAAIVLVAAAAGRAASSLTPASDLQADALLAVTTAQPVIVLFSLPGCRYCDEIRRNYLLPLERDAPIGKRPILREVVITGTGPLTDFSGAVTDERAISTRYQVRVAPTVMLFGRSGQPLASPIVGGDTAGMYGGYLDNALTEARRQMAVR